MTAHTRGDTDQVICSSALRLALYDHCHSGKHRSWNGSVRFTDTDTHRFDGILLEQSACYPLGDCLDQPARGTFHDALHRGIDGAIVDRSCQIIAQAGGLQRPYQCEIDDERLTEVLFRCTDAVTPKKSQSFEDDAICHLILLSSVSDLTNGTA